MAKLYIDTNVVIDAVEGRKNKFGKNIGNPAADLFFEASKCKHQLIISSWMLKELSKYKTLSQTAVFFSLIKHKIIQISHTDEDIENAKKQNSEHFENEIHMTLALRSNADYIITRNVDHFKKCEDKIKISKPEELL